jgi:hypothetical protein
MINYICVQIGFIYQIWNYLYLRRINEWRGCLMTSILLIPCYPLRSNKKDVIGLHVNFILCSDIDYPIQNKSVQILIIHDIWNYLYLRRINEWRGCLMTSILLIPCYPLRSNKKDVISLHVNLLLLWLYKR